MGERKVLNKYFPPDFDPALLPKQKKVRSEDKQMKVRMMLPMSVRCNTCGTYMYKGTKFNTRMEDVRGESYLGIKIFRFYYRCTSCSAEFCMKTDPKNADYIVEGGATRNYEPWREKEKAKVLTAAQREEEERGNAIKALENRTLDSRREMDLMAALDEMISLKSRHARVDTETALEALRRSAEAEDGAGEHLDLDPEDEEAVRQMLLQRAGFVRRLSDSEEEEAAGGGAARRTEPAGTSVEAGPSSRRGKAPPATLSVAAAALEDEEDDDDGSNGAEQEAPFVGDSSQDHAHASGRSANGASTSAVDGARPLGQERHASEQGEPSAASTVTKAPTLPPPSQPAPEITMPRFSARRPAVVVKRKVEPAKPPSPKADAESPGLQGLLGGYGSSESD